MGVFGEVAVTLTSNTYKIDTKDLQIDTKYMQLHDYGTTLAASQRKRLNAALGNGLK